LHFVKGKNLIPNLDFCFFPFFSYRQALAVETKGQLERGSNCIYGTRYRVGPQPHMDSSRAD